jgi:hypothetical protein
MCISVLFACRRNLFSSRPFALELTVSVTERQLSKHTFAETLIDWTLHFSQITFLETFSNLKRRRHVT